AGPGHAGGPRDGPPAARGPGRLRDAVAPVPDRRRPAGVASARPARLGRARRRVRRRGRLRWGASLRVAPAPRFPTGAVLPVSRRLALLAWAERAGAYVVEDDYDGEYRYTARPVE